jgi:hypothetical protein
MPVIFVKMFGDTESGSFKQDTQLSQRAALPALCFTSTNLSKYGNFTL